MVDFGEIPERERNFMRLPFTDPHLRSLYPDRQGLARAVVSYMRMEAARKPDDPASHAEPAQQLVVYTAEPGSRSEQALRELAAWAAEHISAPR